MFGSLRLIYHQVIEALAEGGVGQVSLRRVFWNRLATPVVMDLSRVNFPPEDHVQGTSFQLVEIQLTDLQAGKWSFASPSRLLKAFGNFEKGLRNFAVVEKATVIGDVWTLIPANDGRRISHPDLEMLGIRCEEGEAYAFDMFIVPGYRGKNLAVPLHKFLHSKIKAEGCQRVYGYYWDDNVPALWMHRILRFRELPKRRISRFFFLSKSDQVV